MINCLILKQNGSIEDTSISEHLEYKKKTNITAIIKQKVKLLHKWEMNTIFNNSNVKLNIYGSNISKEENINKHELPPPLNNLDNVYYGDLLLLGIGNNNKLIDFNKSHWVSLNKILNKGEDNLEEEEEEEEEGEEEEEELTQEDIDFIDDDEDEDDDFNEDTCDDTDISSLSSPTENKKIILKINSIELHIYNSSKISQDNSIIKVYL